MKVQKLIELLIADPKLEIEDDDVKSIQFEEGLLSIKTRAKHPLDGTAMNIEAVYTEEEVDNVISKDKNGEYDEVFGFEVKSGTQAQITRLENETKDEKKG